MKKENGNLIAMTEHALPNPSISIIIPVYNAEDFIQGAIESALRQTLKSIEIICVDDGSTDSSIDILQKFKENDSRIQILRQKNMGAGAARNTGIAKASGSYIAFLDADDFYPNDSCLETLYKLALEHDAKIAGGSLLFLKDGRLEKAVLNDTDFTFSATQIIKYKDFQQAYYYQRFIYLRSMLIDGDIRFPDYRRFQDVVFFVNAMVVAGEFVATASPSYAYRRSNHYYTLTDVQIDDMLRGYIDVLSIAKAHDYSKLFSFLSEKFRGRNKTTEMIQASVDSGNQTTQELYADLLNIIGPIPIRKKSKLSQLKSLLYRFRKR